MNWLDRKIDAFIQRVRDNPKIKRIPFGPEDDPVFYRWYVIPKNRWLNVYLHYFRRSDPEDLHDHRMANISILLQGNYLEHRFTFDPVVGLPLPPVDVSVGWQRRPIFRSAETPHRIELYDDFHGRTISVWSLFIGFRRVRDWGFWCMDGRGLAEWVHYEDWYRRRGQLDAAYMQNRSAAE